MIKVKTRSCLIVEIPKIIVGDHVRDQVVRVRVFQ